MKYAKEAVDHLLGHCGRLTPDEGLLVICDETTRDLAEFVGQRAREISSRVEVQEIPPARHHAAALPKAVAARMNKADLIMALTRMSLAHCPERLEAARHGARFLSMPFYDWDLLEDEALRVDFEAQAPVARAVTRAFTEGRQVRVTTPAGTDIRLDITGRRGNCCPGVVKEPGDLGSPPDIEANVSPLESCSEGVVVVDGSIPCPEIGLLRTPVTLEVRSGRIQRFESQEQAYERILNGMFEKASSKRRVLAECGVGLNPSARLRGVMLTDEGALGCVHFGFGSNHTVGGENAVDFHLDFVFRNARVNVDGRDILKDGEVCL